MAKTISFTKLMTSMVLGLSLVNTACSKSASFSLLSDENNFQQNAATTNGKIDILYVIDNSGSMRTSQQALAANFSSFIAEFDAKGFDYQIAVVATDSYKAEFTTDQALAEARAKFRDGTDATVHTGVFIITPQTNDVEGTFINNMLQGTAGNGDERAFQSMRASLAHPVNRSMGFPRADAFLSVIIVSDEDDYSNDTNTSVHQGHYDADASDHSVQLYIDFLDSLMGATVDNRSSKYNVNAITAPDAACVNALGNGGQRVGIRHMDIADRTNGIKGSICEQFGPTLANISNKIIELVSQFYLDRLPVESSLQVFVNGVSVPKLPSSNGDGFFYRADTNSVTFHGTGVPAAGATISVKFDPRSLM